MFALISDVHANREALEAVLACINARGADRIICLGDIVGYGPDPAWCVDTVLKRCDVSVAGNHDVALIYGGRDLSDVADAAVKYHRTLVMPGSHLPGDDACRAGRWQALKALPHRHVEPGHLFVHAAPRNPINEYLRERDVRQGMERKLGENFALVDWVAFIGHTHRPGVITPEPDFIRAERCEGLYRVMPGRKAIVNVGSVGQPRDRDPRACFVTVDGPEICFHRIEYDVEATAAKIETAGALDPRLADRLRTAT